MGSTSWSRRHSGSPVLTVEDPGFSQQPASRASGPAVPAHTLAAPVIQWNVEMSCATCTDTQASGVTHFCSPGLAARDRRQAGRPCTEGDHKRLLDEPYGASRDGSAPGSSGLLSYDQQRRHREFGHPVSHKDAQPIPHGGANGGHRLRGRRRSTLPLRSGWR